MGWIVYLNPGLLHRPRPLESVSRLQFFYAPGTPLAEREIPMAITITLAVSVAAVLLALAVVVVVSFGA